MTDTAANPLVAARHDSTRWYTGLGLVEDVADTVSGIESGSWIDSTIGGVATSMDALATVLDPLGSLVSWGVGWLLEHVKPLSDALDWLAGDPDQIDAYARTWRNVAKQSTDAHADLQAGVPMQLAEWDGASARAYQAYMARQVRAMEGIARAAGGIASLVEGAGLLVALVRELVRDLIADFVSVLAVRLPLWLAEAGATLGIATPLVISQVSSLVAKWAARISRLISLDELPGAHREKRRQRVDTTVQEQHDLLDRLETAGDPLLRVLAVLVPSQENAA
ncbi:WXG100 family type VII secretion target [Micromonospora sp. NPDC048839]|uniref:WXG100 family type VII secretion target n=1 Tax=Micromonospora sp. NPDC048839 TaxID=3155641 RepID=UPI00340B6691